MRRSLRDGMLAGFAAFALLASLATAEPPSRLKVAQDLARAHKVWPQGSAWLKQNQAKTDQVVVPVLNRCLADAPDDGEVTAFSIYLRLSKQGRVMEVLTDIDEELGSCMTRESKDVQLPEAPREDFWIQVNLAASL